MEGKTYNSRIKKGLGTTLGPFFYKQSTCKPGSVCNRNCNSVIYLDCQSLDSSIDLPLGIGRAALKHRYTWPFNPRFARPVRRRNRRCALTTPSHPYHNKLWRLFSSATYTLADIFPLGSLVPCVARTFLLSR